MENLSVTTAIENPDDQFIEVQRVHEPRAPVPPPTTRTTRKMIRVKYKIMLPLEGAAPYQNIRKLPLLFRAIILELWQMMLVQHHGTNLELLPWALDSTLPPLSAPETLPKQDSPEWKPYTYKPNILKFGEAAWFSLCWGYNNSVKGSTSKRIGLL